MIDNQPTAAELRVMRADAARVRAQRLEADAATFAEAGRRVRPTEGADDRVAVAS